MIYNSLPHHTMWIFCLFLFSFFFFIFGTFGMVLRIIFTFFVSYIYNGIDRLTFTYFSFYQFFLQIFIKALFANKNLFACFQNHMHACNLLKLRLKIKIDISWIFFLLCMYCKSFQSFPAWWKKFRFIWAADYYNILYIDTINS